MLPVIQELPGKPRGKALSQVIVPCRGNIVTCSRAGDSILDCRGGATTLGGTGQCATGLRGRRRVRELYGKSFPSRCGILFRKGAGRRATRRSCFTGSFSGFYLGRNSPDLDGDTSQSTPSSGCRQATRPPVGSRARCRQSAHETRRRSESAG